MNGERELRIVLLGKTGVGKSSVGNAILGEEVFKAECSLQSKTQICDSHEKEINGKRIVVIDTPGIFDTHRSEEDLKREIISSLVECAPGPHVFILVLKVERYTKENQEAVEKLLEYFTGDAVHHLVLLFTHGDDLEKNTTITKFINNFDEGRRSGLQTLKGLAEKCGNRVYVIDNKHWDPKSKASAVLEELKKLNMPEAFLMDITAKMESSQTDKTPWFSTLTDQVDSEEQEMGEYRNNRFQLTELMKSIKTILRNSNAQPYHNTSLEEIGEAILEEENNIWEMEAEKKPENLRKRAKERVRTKLWRRLAGVATGILLGALLGVGVGVAAPVVLVAGLIRAAWRKATGKGAVPRYKASQTSDNSSQTAKKVARTLVDKAGKVLETCWNVGITTETGNEAKNLLNKND